MSGKTTVGRITIVRRYGCFRSQKKVKYFVKYSPVKCPYCNTTFINKVYLKRHIKIFHAKRQCPICGKCFYDIFEFNRHVREHLSTAKND